MLVVVVAAEQGEREGACAGALSSASPRTMMSNEKLASCPRFRHCKTRRSRCQGR